MDGGHFMEVYSQHMARNQWLTEAINEAKRIEEDTLFSSRKNAIAANHWHYMRYILGLPAVILSALISAAAVKQNQTWGVAIPIILTILASLTTFLNPTQKEKEHHDYDVAYLDLRNDARAFYKLEVNDVSNSEQKLKEMLEKLRQRRAALNAKAPRTPFYVYWLARQSIEKGQSTYQVDKA